MPKKREAWRKTFKTVLQPKLLKALRDDKAGRVPLRAAQRRACKMMLGCLMSPVEIRAALVNVRPTRKTR